MPSVFSPAGLRALDSTAEVEIETTSPAGTLHRTTIWVVVDGEDVFIRSYRGETARWYREALEHPGVAILAGPSRLAACAVPAPDPGSVARASAGFEAKYARDPSTRAMLRPEVLPTTLRLEPA